MMSVPPRDIILCVFFLNNDTESHGNQVRKNENTFANCAKELDTELEATSDLGATLAPGGEALCCEGLSLQVSGAPGSPSGSEVLLWTSRDHPPFPGRCHAEWLGQSSSLMLSDKEVFQPRGRTGPSRRPGCQRRGGGGQGFSRGRGCSHPHT